MQTLSSRRRDRPLSSPVTKNTFACAQLRGGTPTRGSRLTQASVRLHVRRLLIAAFHTSPIERLQYQSLSDRRLAGGKGGGGYIKGVYSDAYDSRLGSSLDAHD